MNAAVNSFRIFARSAAALGFLAVGLTGELSVAWTAMSASVWFFSFFFDRYPHLQARLRRLETPAVAGMIAMILVDFFIFKNAVFLTITHFLLLFQIVKLMGEKTRKDCVQIFIFSFFQILAACTLSVDAWYAIILLALIPVATSALFWNQMAYAFERTPGSEENPETHRRSRTMALMISAAALPLTILLTLMVFVLFPRLTLNVALPGFAGKSSGYTDQVNLSQQGAIEQDSSVVLWLAFPRPEDRAAWNGYLRGDVLNRFDGQRWVTARTSTPRLIAPDSNGLFTFRARQPASTLVHQVITLADTSASTIFSAGRPIRLSAPLPALQETEGESLHWLAAWRRPLRYELTSENSFDQAVTVKQSDLPAIELNEIRRLAQRVAGQGTVLQQAQRLEAYLRTSYGYTTSFGNTISKNPVADFLFERKQGTCGHFASAMALMLRLQNIPSRIVAGYLKGEWNEPARCVVIRQRDAHAWVEAYIPGQGWTAFDPTPAPAAAAPSHRNVMTMMRQYWDYVSLQWNRFIIQYDLYSQIKAFETIKGRTSNAGSSLAVWWSKFQNRDQKGSKPITPTAEDPSPSHLPYISILALAVLSIAGFMLFRFRHHKREDPSITFYRTFLQRMAKAGYPKASHETGWEFAERIASLHKTQEANAKRITEMYYQVRFRL